MSQDSSKLSGVQRLLEAGLLVTCVVAMYLMLSLYSFNIADPGWSQTGYQVPVRNLGGAIGAYLSDLLLSIFGWLAYSIPFVIALIGWLSFRRFYQLMQIDYLTLGLKILGFILFYIGATAIASMNIDDIYYFSAGGIVGDYLSTSLLPYLSFVGSSLLFLLFVCSGLVFLTGISWLDCIDNLGRYTIAGALALVGLPKLLQEKFAASPIEPSTQVDATPALASADDLADNMFESADSVEKESEKVNSKSKKGFFSFGKKSKDEDIDSINSTDSDLHKTSDEAEVEHALAQVNEINETGHNTQESSMSNERKEPFVAIDDLIEGPIHANVQAEVREEEITAAFETVAKPKVVELEPELPAATESSQHNNDSGAVESGENDDKYQGLPSLDLLDRPDKATNPIDQEELDQVSRLVEAKLIEFGVKASVVAVFPGPVITRFELDLAPGVKVSKITGLSKDLARSLSAKSVRVVEVIEGKSVIGIELPNKHRETVMFSDVISCAKFDTSPSNLAMAIGSDISGNPVIADLAKMPHLLVAGTTGSGKSVAVNTMIVSILYKSSPEDVRMIMIDPKQVELSVYDGIPHLLSEVVTDMKEAANALRWCVGEMERRYQLMSKLGVRNLKGFNAKVKEAIDNGEPLIDPLWQPNDAFSQTPPKLEKLPSIVIVVDEFADMMMIVGKKVEELIARIAQKARAAGIHLILATQRPSADVITGLIKANIPTRMALRVQSRIESRIILDQQGAEQLLGMGDMFYLPPGEAVPIRVHGAFVDDHEVHAVVSDWKSRGEPNYLDEILSGEMEQEILLPGEQPEGGDEELDTLYDEALAFVTETRRVSISSVQRKFRIGYNRAARIVEQMEMQGVVSTPGHNGAREVLAPPPVKE
ncbi:DNA translocase FtsK 4TM domain-containing protein [Endozoicomonas sp. G2_1]|uniref:DNA translocase FtsK n=1 Tax=Endozoicomonas sp. G2_1 TaxID=2821091 RepID=UPI001ADB0D69|nr:DNA translocase FtsK 4TM domain-containing protein [Endozoicomonas sp. G2_1]MBO9490535.1 DNA translocase FtsK 4TM domain-containing protein [Endozoicomonas sp. G2_1]